MAATPILDGPKIRALLTELSTHLGAAGSFNNNLTIVGGAALALRNPYQPRATYDVDVIEHRFWYPHNPQARTTGAVDFISTAIPPKMRQAAAEIAHAHRLPTNWLNGAAAIFTPAGELHPEMVFDSDTLTVRTPSAEVLLTMKLHAARINDLDDAVALIDETAITDPKRLLASVTEAYGKQEITHRTLMFIERALTVHHQRNPAHQRRHGPRPPELSL